MLSNDYTQFSEIYRKKANYYYFHLTTFDKLGQEKI